MALVTFDTVQVLLGLTGTASAEVLTVIAAAADRAVKAYCRRGRAVAAFPLWPESGSDTEYYDGKAEQTLVLNYWPVSSITSVNLDNGGYYGDGPNAFGTGTALTAGTDFVLVRDDGAVSASARLRRLGGFGGFNVNDDYGFVPYGSGSGSRGSLAGRKGPVWPRGWGNLKIVYVAGYTTLPADLTYAANELAVWLYRTRQYGGMPAQSESLGEYSYSLALGAINHAPEFGSIRAMLAPYRDIRI